MRVLAIIGFCAVVVFLTVLGINVLAAYDSDLIKMHPPDAEKGGGEN